MPGAKRTETGSLLYGEIGADALRREVLRGEVYPAGERLPLDEGSSLTAERDEDRLRDVLRGVASPPTLRSATENTRSRCRRTNSAKAKSRCSVTYWRSNSASSIMVFAL